jgi:Uma2 family endonuclease
MPCSPHGSPVWEPRKPHKFRSEYFDGEMFAKTGSNRAHSLVVVNVMAELHRQLRSRPCLVYLVDLRVHVPTTGACAYRDVMAVCGESRFLDDQEDTLLNPGLIVEVLSPSTEACDRGRKFEHYKSIESLREYVLVASDRIHADLYTHQPDGRWLLTSADKLEDSLTLESVDAQLTLADVYEKVETRPLKL